MTFPIELQLKILSYIEPNPVVYTRLAMVSKFYYSLYTSDEKWSALDVQGIETDIFKYYLEASDLQELKRCWSDTYKDYEKDFLELYADNQGPDLIYEDSLASLGLIRHNFSDWIQAHLDSPHCGDFFAPTIASEQYARVAIALDYRMLSLVSSLLLLENRDILEQCVRRDPTCLNWLDGPDLHDHKELLMAELKKGTCDLAPACANLLDDDFDGMFLWEACEYQSGLHSALNQYNQDPRLEIKVWLYQHLLGTYSRAELNEIFNCGYVDIPSNIELFRAGIAANPYLLRYADDNVRDDEQVMLRAAKVRAECLNYASGRLKNDANFCAAAVNSNPNCSHFFKK